MTEVIDIPIAEWDQPCSAAEQRRAALALESGNVVLLPNLRFALRGNEDRLLTEAVAGQAKNVSLDPVRGVLRGSDAGEAELTLLRGVMSRFASLSRALIGNLLPFYQAHLQQARTSFRPIEVAGRATAWRKDDTRLHVDSFPSSPTQGTRILRVFTNLHPGGRVRKWRLGEPFEQVAQRYLRALPGPIWGASVVLHSLGLTKGRRSDYDHYMLRLHDRMKADMDYQSAAAQSGFDFPAGSTWIVFTDQVSHAAMSGQYALEQTFHLPVQAMLDPSRSPLRILERLLGRPLT
jgi:hypothetical protein